MTMPMTIEPVMLMTKVCIGKCVPASLATQMFMKWRITPPTPAPTNTTR